MKGDIISCTHNEIYFLETNTKSESTELANLFASSTAGRNMVQYKPRTKLKHKLNPALDFFLQTKKNQTLFASKSNSLPEENNNDNKGSSSSNSNNNSNSTSKIWNRSSRRNSLDLYEEAAAILGLTCSQTNNCKCIECQCHYFDFEEEIEFPNGNEYVMDHHASSCTIQ